MHFCPLAIKNSTQQCHSLTLIEVGGQRKTWIKNLEKDLNDLRLHPQENLTEEVQTNAALIPAQEVMAPPTTDDDRSWDTMQFVIQPETTGNVDRISINLDI